jgi:ring-1,2-phenylacetyl-CoA epoxidase subunit PaaD
VNAVIDAEPDSASRAAVQTEAQARAVAGAVADPELPYLDLDDLGVLREVRVTGPSRIRVTVTPTFLGCPATAVIQRDIESALREQGWVDVDVSLVHSPAWTPDRISDRGRAKLAAEGYGIPARGGATGGPVPVTIGLKPVSSNLSESAALPLACPQCGAADTAVLSPFGATPCMEMRRCTSCGEPFPALRPVNHLGSGPE